MVLQTAATTYTMEQFLLLSSNYQLSACVYLRRLTSNRFKKEILSSVNLSNLFCFVFIVSKNSTKLHHFLAILYLNILHPILKFVHLFNGIFFSAFFYRHQHRFQHQHRLLRPSNVHTAIINQIRCQK